jgi:hypothetical protein
MSTSLPQSPSSPFMLKLCLLLECFYECVSDILHKNVERSEFLCEYSQILMLVDNMIDNGVILEVDADEVLDSMPGRGGNGNNMLAQSLGKGGMKSLGDMTAGQLLNSAKNMLKQGGLK